MENLARGQRLPLSNIVAGNSVRVGLQGQGLPLDFACFGLDAQGKLSDDRYMIFFNQATSPCGGISLTGVTGDLQGFQFELEKVPQTIDRIVITTSIDGSGTMSQLQSGYLRLLDQDIEKARFAFSGTDFSAEKAVMLAEFYRKDGLWRFMTIGQGFNGGLDALVTHFGGSLAEPAPAPASEQAEVKKVSLSKVSLTKVGQTHKVSLEKGAGAPRKLVVKATWLDNGDGEDDNDDLDLRVGLLLPDGKMKFITAPDAPGSFMSTPYALHLGDTVSASAKEPATEVVEVNPDIAKLSGGQVVMVFSVYSALSNGAVSVASMRPKMVMQYGEQIVECDFDFRTSKYADDDTVYTYVIGTAVINEDSITLAPSGKTSEPGSENTPWILMNGNEPRIEVMGPAVFKGKEKSKEAQFNKGNPYKYV